jgi:hypothetical protein
MKDDKSEKVEEILRRRFADAEMPDTSGLWKKISAAIPDEPQTKPGRVHFIKRYQYLIAACVMAFLLSSGLIVYLSMQEKKAGIALKTPGPQTKIEDTSSVAPKPRSLPEVVSNKKYRRQEQKSGAHFSPRKEKFILAIETKADKSDFSLPDGTRVTLNSHSRLSYVQDFNPNNRIVSFTGEGFFEVKKMEGAPFTIYANGSRTIVLGTSFNLRSNPEEATDEVEVVSGKVRFSPLVDSAAIVLLPGSRGMLDKSNGQLFKTESTDQNFLSWKTEKLVFHNTPVKNVVSDLQKYFHVKINVSNNDLLNCRFTSNFQQPDFRQVLDILFLTGKINYTLEGDIYVLSGPGCQVE